MLVAALLSAATGVAGAWLLANAHLAGLALLAASVLLLRWPTSIWDLPAAPEPAPRTRAVLLLAIVAVAAFARLWRIDQPGLWGDDAINGLLAFDVLDGRIRSPFQLIAHAHSMFHALSNYLIAGAFLAFGADLWTLRLPGVLLGIAGAPLLYGIVAPLFGARAGLIAALFYAVSPPQLTHAKQLVQIIAGEAFLLAGLCLLVRGWAARRTGLIAAAGVPLAGCVYTYHAARLAPLVAAAFVLAALWEEHRQRRGGTAPRAPARRALATVLLAATLLLALAPALRGWLRDPGALTGRVNATSIWVAMSEQRSWAPLWDAAWRTLGMFHYQQGPEYHWFGLAFDPAVNVVVGGLVLHGLVASLLGWRQPRHILLLVWFAVGLLPGLLSSGAPRLYRSLLALPPVHVWAALPLAQLLVAAGRRPAPALRALALALVIAVPVLDLNYYFYRVYTHPLFHWFHGERMVEMARTLRAHGAGWTGYLLADNFDARHETLLFLSRAWNLRIENVASLADVLPVREPPPGGVLYMMSEAMLPAAAAIEHVYPDAELSLRYEPRLRSWPFDDWWPLATWGDRPRTVSGFVSVDAAALRTPHTEPPIGLIGTYQIGRQRVQRLEPYPLYALFPATFARPFSARFNGRLRVPADGYRLAVEANAGATLWLNGRRISPTEALPQGEHAFGLSLKTVPDRLRLRLNWTPPGRPPEPVPPVAFVPRPR